MTSEQIMPLVLAAFAAPGFWAVVQLLIEKISEALTGKKKVTLNEIGEKLDNHQRDIDSLKTSLTTMRSAEEEQDAVAARRRILRFNDELLRDIEHSKEYFDDILEDVHAYEMYCDTHTEFQNEKAVMAIKNIRRCYERCMEKHSFLN